MTTSQRYLDRETSELAYHARVLARASDPTLPVLERAKFLAIFSTLTDEFFRVRVARLVDQIDAGLENLSRAGHSLVETLDGARRRFRELQDEQYVVFEDRVVEGLAAEGVTIVRWDDLDASSREQMGATFRSTIEPILTPLAVGPAHPFPFISDLSLSLGVTLADESGPGFGRVKVPESLDRFLPVGDGSTGVDGEVGDGRPVQLLPVEELIGAHLGSVFPGRSVEHWSTFRVLRNADYDVDDDDVADLLDAVSSELADRRFGHAVRLDVDSSMPSEMLDLLRLELDLSRDDVFVQDRPLGLGDLWDLRRIDRADLKETPWVPARPQDFEGRSIFDLLDEADRLVHHPYESFAATTQRFIADAAADDDVLAMKQTMYRTSGDSPIVRALAEAAAGTKQVAALIELKARFDEAANIRWAGQLEDAGVHVVYGFVDMKTHTKISLVIRQDDDGVVRRYGHFATGNYNPTTAESYEDLGFFTADPVLMNDLSELFNMLTTHSRSATFERLLVAPINLLDSLVESIRGQAKPDGRIVIKVNSLTHEGIIDELYAAGRAGADVDLVVRGICCLRPGVDGLSENIRVRSVVGPFLEHSRIFRFGSEPAGSEYLIGSADLMTRNLERRVEAVVPIDDPDLRRRLDVILELCLADTELAWSLDGSGRWSPVGPAVDGAAVNVQTELKRVQRPEVF